MTYAIRRPSTTTSLLALVVAFAMAMATACKGGGSEADQAPSSADNTGGSAPAESPAEPAGTEAIDHAGITEVPGDRALADEGKKLFKSKGCTACHKMDSKLVGPALGGRARNDRVVDH